MEVPSNPSNIKALSDLNDTKNKPEDESYLFFDSLYQNGGWEGKGSGPGSEPKTQVGYLALLGKIIGYTPSIKTILDIGCGDWQLMRNIDLSKHQYLGIDVSQMMVEINNKKFKNENVKFKLLNPVFSDLPLADLIIIKDVLQHLPIEHIQIILNKIRKQSNILITNDFTHTNVSYDIKVGDWRPVNVLKPPYDFPGITIAGFDGKHTTLTSLNKF